MRQPAAKKLSARLPYDEVRRLELALRMRSWALSRGAAHERCPGCGMAIAPGDERHRIKSVTAHPGCVPGSIAEPPG